MSYDLAVFDPSSAPRERKAFLDWYRKQTEWSESHGYDDPKVSTPELRSWFMAMIATFPPMNGPLASEDVDDPHVTDYSIGRSLIYAAFAWSIADEARALVVKLANQHRVGFFDVSAENGAIVLPKT